MTATSTASASTAMPALFVAHGAPMLLDEPDWMGELAGWAKALPKPKAVLMVSAHWETRPLAIGATTTVPLVYDFYGFPERFYRLQYPSPGAPTLAARVRELLDARSIAWADDPQRGLDHGSFVPLMAMYPQADVPVLQISLPGEDPKTLLAMGQALAPLRDEGVLLMGSGFITHNMRLGMQTPTPAWAKEFDLWTKEALVRHDVDALLDYQAKGPAARMALPTQEHFVPLLVALGAAGPQARVQFPIEGWWMGAGFTKRSVQLG